MLELQGEEGGGQLLRTALSLSLVTGTPFVVQRLRAAESQPGLRPQDLAFLRALQAVSDSQVEGAVVGSERVAFRPQPVRSGAYLLDAGSAGGTSLLLQCLTFPLALAGGGSLVVRGSTHGGQGPAYPYLAWVWRPALRALGVEVKLSLLRAGFAGDGGGEVRLEISPWTQGPERVVLPARGTLRAAVVTTLFGGIALAEAQLKSRAASQALREHGILCEEEHLPLPTRASGHLLMARLQFEHTVAGFSDVDGKALAQQVVRFMEGGGSLDAHLAEQLLLPAALLAAGRVAPGTHGLTWFEAPGHTPSLLQTAELVQRFLEVRVTMQPPGAVEVAYSSSERGGGGRALGPLA